MSGDIYRTLLLYTTGDPGNWFHYSNPEFDALVEELAVTADEARVREIEKGGDGHLVTGFARRQSGPVL